MGHIMYIDMTQPECEITNSYSLLHKQAKEIKKKKSATGEIY